MRSGALVGNPEAEGGVGEWAEQQAGSGNTDPVRACGVQTNNGDWREGYKAQPESWGGGRCNWPQKNIAQAENDQAL